MSHPERTYTDVCPGCHDVLRAHDRASIEQKSKLHASTCPKYQQYKTLTRQPC